MNRRTTIIVFAAIFLFQAAFGFYYAWSEFVAKGPPQGFDPLATGRSYIYVPGYEFNFGDKEAYNKLAYSLVETGEYRNPFGEVSAWVTPGLPLMLAFIYSVFGYWFLPVLVFNALCVTVAYYYLYKLALDQFGQSVAFVVLCLLVINLRVSYHIGNVLTEPLFLALCSMAVYITAYLLSNNTKTVRPFLILGLVIGYGFLVRPVMIPLLLVLTGFLFHHRLPLRGIAVTVALSGSIASAWIIRNYVHFDRIVVSTNGEWGLAAAHHDGYDKFSFFDTYELLDGISIPTLIRESGNAVMDDSVFQEQKSFLGKQAFDRWRSANWSSYVWLSAWRLKALLSPYTVHMSTRNKLVATVLWLLTIAPAFGAIPLLYRNRAFVLIVVSAMSLLLMPSAVLVDKYLRYQLPAQLLLTIPSGYFIYRVAQWSGLLKLIRVKAVRSVGG